MNNDHMYITKCEKRDNLPESREERLLQGVEIWTQFWRANPSRFFQDLSGIKLHPFQVHMFQMIETNDGSCWITTRGRLPLPHYIEIYS